MYQPVREGRRLTANGSDLFLAPHPTEAVSCKLQAVGRHHRLDQAHHQVPAFGQSAISNL
jgi:hypothetical protein